VRYIAAFVAALRWVRDPAHRAEAVGLLKEKFKLTDAGAERTYDLLVDPAFGFNGDARFDPKGFRNLLALRGNSAPGRGGGGAGGLRRPRLFRPGDPAARARPPLSRVFSSTAKPLP
jgi:hypothetical protein